MKPRGEPEAKMTKTQAIELGKQDGRKNAEMLALNTAEQLEPMDWNVRQAKAGALAHVAMVGQGEVIPERWRSDYRDAYANAILNMWGSTLKQRENARRHFRSACSGLTTEQARAKVVEIVNGFNLRGATVSERYVEVRRAGNGRINSTLYFDFDRSDEVVENPDDPQQRAFSYRLRVTLGTQGTTYTTSEMAVANKLHTELLDVACELEAAFQHEQVVSTWGIPQVEGEVK